MPDVEHTRKMGDIMVRKLFLMTVVLGAASCQMSEFGLGGGDAGPEIKEYRTKPTSPLAAYGVTKVAVLMLNATNSTEVDLRETGQIFSSELQQFEGLAVFPAAVTQAAATSSGLKFPEQSHLFARSIGVDALIVGFITDFQPYEHPRVGIMLRVYPSAPVEKPAPVASAALTLERVYDADTTVVAAQVRSFAANREGRNSPMGDRQYLMVTSKYMHFVADRSIRDLFAEARYRWREPMPASTGVDTKDETTPEASGDNTGTEQEPADTQPPHVEASPAKGNADGP